MTTQALNTDLNALTFQGTGTGVDAKAGIATAQHAGRRDGRMRTEMRPQTIKQSVLTSADGSARIRAGATDVLVAVYGPMDCPIPRQRSEGLQVQVAYRKREGAAGVSDSIAAGVEAVAARDLRQMVLEVLLAALHPRKAVVVAVQVLADHGSLGAVVVNACVMALIDAGVPLQAVPTAACVSVHNDTIVVDPVRVEEMEANAVLTFTFDTFLASENGFMSVYTEGDCGGDRLFAAAGHISRELAAKTRALLKLSLEQKASYPYLWNSSKPVS